MKCVAHHIIGFAAQFASIAAAATFTPVWQLGTDDGAFSPFSSPSYNSNTTPGSAAIKDDDYYLAGSFPSPIGILATAENIENFEREISQSDPRNRIHFPLTAAQASAASRLRLTIDFAWGGHSGSGYGTHNVAVTINGQSIGVTEIKWYRTLSFTIPASSVTAISGANVIQIERLGGITGGTIQFDYLKLEVDSDALADGDSDGLVRWFEEDYGLSDSNAADATQNLDGDGLTNLAEFQAGTNPTSPDSDSDGIKDSQEISAGTSPLKADTDGDGLSDLAETTSNPLLADTDGDTYPDNIELEKGTSPTNASSVPFAFPGAISLQFVCENLTSSTLSAGEPAGYFRVPHWNASDPLPSWSSNSTVINGSKSALKNHRGQATSAAASWSFHHAQDGFHKSPSEGKLFNGMIRSQRRAVDGTTPAINTPAIVTLTGIPYASYDLLVYVGYVYPNRQGVLRRTGDAASARYFVSESGPPFMKWNESTATTQAGIVPGNYMRYRNLSGASQTVTLESLEYNAVGLHGVQIINTATDTDGDGMSDTLEIEKGFNPAISDGTEDADADGMNNAAELTASTDPHHSDTDRDGILDGAEAGLGISPIDADSDNDGITDGTEINSQPFSSLPTLVDSDADGFTDLVEKNYGSNPRSNTSTPPPVPIWNATTRTWLWRIDNVRVHWNHNQSMLGALGGNDRMLFEAVAEINQGGWGKHIGIGINYVGGRLLHRFRTSNGVFFPSGSPNSGLWGSEWRTTVDRTRDFGFSGYGKNDDSVPLRLEFSAVQPTEGINIWTVNFILADLTNPSTPVTLASYNTTTAAAGDPSLLSGTTVWQNDDGIAGRIEFWNDPGVTTHISATALLPADNDNDGMPNTWETTHTFNLNSNTDATLDADLDGLTNVKEFLAGTNPRDTDSDDDGVSDSVELNRGFNPLLSTSLPAGYNFTGKIDDLDNDGMSDSWVLWSGGIARLPSRDDDGDGKSNLEESKAGTDPDDPNSRLESKAWKSNSDFVLSWTNLPYKANHVEFSDGMGTWQVASGLPAATINGDQRQVLIASVFPPTSNKRFYRAGVRPLDSDADGVEDWIEKNVLESSTTNASSLGQSLVKANGQTLGGDAIALLDQLQGSAVSGGTSGSTAPAQPSAINAARFLMQASFGPTVASISQVRSLGYEGWINQQRRLPISLGRPYIQEIKADVKGPRSDLTYSYNADDSSVNGVNVTTPFARHAVSGADQLRQRVAFALSQILVVSRKDANLSEKPEAMANYYDMLSRHALGNYRDLLREVTFHPAMGWYLSHAGNQKADPTIPRYPDENYAREIMQLFTIGLWELNPDGSRKLNAQGAPIPTYDNGDITELARVFTGLYYKSKYGWGGGAYEDDHFLQPLVMYPERHDFEAKVLPTGRIIPAREPSETAGIQEVQEAVDTLFDHPNTPPFVSRQLIQFLVTDNPSPEYIRRIQDVFVNDGSGVRGNLGAVVKAILLDIEARTPPISASFGKVREPVIRLMHLSRILNLGEAHPKFVWWNHTSLFYDYCGQEPLNAPSVFNFFNPIYQAPGDIRNNSLVSPGFQIINTYSAVSFPNLLWDYLHDGLGSGWDIAHPFDYSQSLLLGEQPAALVDHVDLLLCAGSMTARTRGILLTELAKPALTPKDRVALAIWTALNCPEGVVQK